MLVVDANIVLAAALGTRSGRSLEWVGQHRELTISEDAAVEILSVAEALVRRGRDARALAASYLATLSIRPRDSYTAHVSLAAQTLRHAVASRNGSVADAHLLALAWRLEADIWSHDRDFAGTGWPSWSSANLVEALDAAPALDPEA